MSKYVAFLRAINVGGHVVKMDALRGLFEGLKFSNVETFIASGNVIFDTKAMPDQRLELKIEKHLESELGYGVAAFVRSIDEIRAISVYQPFSKEAVESAHVVNVGFIRESLTPTALELAMAFGTDVDDFHFQGREVYWLTRIPQNESKFPAKKFEKVLGGAATWRNTNTIARIAAKYGP